MVKLVDPKIRHLKTEIVGSDILDEVGFVKYHCTVIGNDLAKLVVADVQVGAKEVVINDDDVGVLGAHTHTCDKARFEIFEILRQTRYKNQKIFFWMHNWHAMKHSAEVEAFGREEKEFTWEKTDKAETLRKAAGL